MKRSFGAFALALILCVPSLGIAAANRKKPVWTDPPVVVKAQKGVFTWDPGMETLTYTEGAATRTVADTLSKNPNIQVPKEGSDKATGYFLNDGELYAFFANPNGGPEVEKVVPEAIRKYTLFSLNEYAGVALTASGKLVLWKTTDYNGQAVGEGVSDYLQNPSFGKKPNCLPLHHVKYGTYLIFFSGRDKEVRGIEWFAKEQRLRTMVLTETVPGAETLEQFLKAEKVGSCTLVGP